MIITSYGSIIISYTVVNQASIVVVLSIVVSKTIGFVINFTWISYMIYSFTRQKTVSKISSDEGTVSRCGSEEEDEEESFCFLISFLFSSTSLEGPLLHCLRLLIFLQLSTKSLPT